MRSTILRPGRRALLQGGAALIAWPALLREGRTAELSRFALGIASGQPHADGMVLWTRLTGAGLPDQVPVQWEVASDESFQQIVAHGEEVAEVDWSHSVHPEPRGLAADRWYWYRFRALGQQSMVGRTRTAPAADDAGASFNFVITSCQRWDLGYYGAWKHIAAEPGLDAVMFLGDYIYEYPSSKRSLRPVDGGHVRTLAQYRARYATHKSDPALQAAHAAVPWLLVWDDHEVGNDYANMQGQELQPDFREQRAAAYRAYWEHMPFPQSARPVGPDMRIVGRLDWGRLARIHLVDDRQYRDVQVCPHPGRGGSNTVLVKDCPAMLDPARTLLGAEQETWLANGWDTARPWNLLAQQTLMARHSWSDIAVDGGKYWTDGWDGYPAARNRLLRVVAERKVTGVVVLGGDVHGNYVADLKADYDDPLAKVIATEFCGTSITSPSHPQAREDALRPYNPHIRYAHSDQRGYMRFSLQPKQLQVQVRVVDALDSGSGVTTAANFAVDAGRPGALNA